FSGFGCFMADHISDPMSYGIYIVDRRHKNAEESVQQLAHYMFDYTKLNRRQRIIQRNRTERLSDILDWRNLGVYYHNARRLALHRVFPDLIGEDDDDDARSIGRFSYPRPISEPPSPSSSRATTPLPASDSEDEIDEERERPTEKVFISLEEPGWDDSGVLARSRIVAMLTWIKWRYC
ncbi:unnamed protein product, partial [Notodromas monacha]